MTCSNLISESERIRISSPSDTNPLLLLALFIASTPFHSALPMLYAYGMKVSFVAAVGKERKHHSSHAI